MTKKKPENPLAFPFVENGKEFGNYYGMSLRDYFAAAALQGMIAGSQGLSITTEEFASQSYALAYAMLQERKKTERKSHG